LRQLTAESALLASAAGAAGLLLASWSLRAFAGLVPETLRDTVVPRLDGRVVWFAAGVTIATALVFGVLPAFMSMRRNAGGALAAGTRATERAGARTLRRTLVIGEVALTVVLVSAAALLARTFTALMRADLGFSPAQVLTMQVPRSDGPDGTPDRRLAFYRTLTSRLAAIPGVRAVGLTNGLPVRFTGGGSGFFPEDAGKDAAVSANHRVVSGGYFAALQIPIVEGRTFMPADVVGRQPVAVVSHSFAARAWPGRDPIGRRFTWGQPAADNPAITVVGVAGDVRLARSLEPTPHVYFAFTQVPDYVTGDLAIRVDGDPLGVAAAVRAAIREIDPDQPVADMATYDRLLASSSGRRRFTLSLMAVFASLALALAAVGLYGVIAFLVSRRTREIGVRLALGAAAGSVRVAVLKDGLLLAAAGAACGIVLSLGAARWAGAWLPGVARLDWVSIAVAVAAVFLAGVFACDVPARRAARVDPISALRVD
jgi:putative ABC transport system permease protein